MPGAKNVSFKALFNETAGKLHDNTHIERVFKEAGVNVSRLKDEPVVLSCGSGVTASALYFALERLGLKKLAVYDGSWTEYASLNQGPIVKD
jgi:thiosulfate/3-mercaptopyruvate sulfurtransferase